MGALRPSSTLIRSIIHQQFTVRWEFQRISAGICTLCCSTSRPVGSLGSGQWVKSGVEVGEGWKIRLGQGQGHSYGGWVQRRYKSEQWAARQTKDPYTKAAKIAGMKSRAGWKLHELNFDHKLFKPGMTVVDLGFAPGAWTDVAVKCTNPGGRVLGVDIIPAFPPSGASTIQGDFLDERVQENIRRWVSEVPDLSLQNSGRGMIMNVSSMGGAGGVGSGTGGEGEAIGSLEGGVGTESERKELELQQREKERERKREMGREMVDVVISDMWEPWELTSGQWINSVKNVYNRLMNVSGIRFKDHMGSMDLCTSALLFCVDVLKPGGTFVCKFYQGQHDRELEKGLKVLFRKVVRVKPDSSRKESREGYFVAKEKLSGISKNEVLKVMPNLV